MPLFNCVVTNKFFVSKVDGECACRLHGNNQAVANAIAVVI